MEHFAFRRMRVYQRAVRVVEAVYRATRGLPPDAAPIVSQLMRCTSSIGLNIAEGAGEIRRPEKARFYRVARRSSWEAVAALDMLRAAGLLKGAELDPVEATLAEIGAMLTGLIKYQESEHARSSRNTRSARPKSSPHPP